MTPRHKPVVLLPTTAALSDAPGFETDGGLGVEDWSVFKEKSFSVAS
jgi:hypothetical protein